MPNTARGASLQQRWTMNYDEDPLDLFDDDGDGVIETIVLLDEDNEDPKMPKTGCALLCMALGSSGGLGWWVFFT